MKLTSDISEEEYAETKELNRRLLEENSELKIQVSHLQKQLAKEKEARLDVN